LFRLRWSRTEGNQVYKRRSNDDQTTNEVAERRQNENLKGGRDFQRVKVGKSGLTEADPLLSQNRSMSNHFITWRLYGVELTCSLALVQFELLGPKDRELMALSVRAGTGRLKCSAARSAGTKS